MGAIFETPDMITEDKGRGILFGTFSGTGGLVLAGSRRQRLARGDAPPHRHHQRGRHDHHPDGLGDDARSPPRPSVDLDLPTRSVLVGGLERWEMRQGVFKLVEESRLAKMIERTLKTAARLDPGCSLSLRTPPLAQDMYGAEPPGVAVTVFPTRFVCEAEIVQIAAREIRRRRLVRWSELDPAGGRRRYALESGKKWTSRPFVSSPVARKAICRTSTGAGSCMGTRSAMSRCGSWRQGRVQTLATRW